MKKIFKNKKFIYGVIFLFIISIIFGEEDTTNNDVGTNHPEQTEIDTSEDTVEEEFKTTDYNEYVDAFAERMNKFIKTKDYAFGRCDCSNRMEYLNYYIYSEPNYDIQEFAKECDEIYKKVEEINKECNYKPEGFLKDDIYVTVSFYYFEGDKDGDKYIDNVECKPFRTFQFSVRDNEWKINDGIKLE